ncbi:hypothetical protein ACPCI0_08825 [Streptomyces griseoincarnatus]
MPYRPFYPPADVPVAQVAIRGEHIGRRTGVRVPLVGTVADTAGALLPLLREKSADGFADRLTKHYRRVRARLDDLAEARPHDAPMHPQHVAARWTGWRRATRSSRRTRAHPRCGRRGTSP